MKWYALYIMLLCAFISSLFFVSSVFFIDLVEFYRAGKCINEVIEGLIKALNASHM